MRPPPYNPLDKKHLGESVADALLLEPPKALSDVEPFLGAGVYAIYYYGPFPSYTPIAKRNRASMTLPIYVGKAVPPGARKGGQGADPDPGRALHKRLGEHRTSISEVSNLSLDHFSCRYLVVDDIWIPLGESLLIEKFSPVWNVVVDGFGIHKPGKGRANQECSAWDTLHPGRKLAIGLPPNSKSQKQISIELEEFFLRLAPQ